MEDSDLIVFRCKNIIGTTRPAVALSISDGRRKPVLKLGSINEECDNFEMLGNSVLFAQDMDFYIKTMRALKQYVEVCPAKEVRMTK